MIIYIHCQPRAWNRAKAIAQRLETSANILFPNRVYIPPPDNVEPNVDAWRDAVAAMHVEAKRMDDAGSTPIVAIPSPFKIMRHRLKSITHTVEFYLTPDSALQRLEFYEEPTVEVTGPVNERTTIEWGTIGQQVAAIESKLNSL